MIPTTWEVEVGEPGRGKVHVRPFLKNKLRNKGLEMWLE
jgi:hypothetical protein